MITNKLKLIDNTIPKEYENIDFSVLGKIMEESSKRLALTKEQIIKDRCDKLGIVYDLDKEQNKLFKSFVIVVEGSKETLFYNDGSENGLRIVTFEFEPRDTYNTENNKFELSTKLKYY